MRRFSKAIAWMLALILLLSLPMPIASAEEESPRIVMLRADGAVVRVKTDVPVSAYCISTTNILADADSPDWRPCEGTGFSAFKMDGDYFVRVRTESGAVSAAEPVTVRSGFTYTIEAEGVRPLSRPILDVLAENGDTLEAFNAALAKSAIDGGLYTREGVACVCLALLSRLSRYGLTLAYQPSGNYTRKGDWGLSAAWGTPTGKTERDYAGVYTRYGMNCGTIIAWAYKQAGLNLVGDVKHGYYDYGMHRRYDDNIVPLTDGDTGDIIATSTGHTILILDRVDTDGDGLMDSYLVFEMESPYLKLKIRSLHSVRLCRLYDMSALFSDTGVRRSSARFWEGSFYIPSEAFPDAYRGERAADNFARTLSASHVLLEDAAPTLSPVKVP